MRPRRGWYALGGVLVFLGATVAVALLASFLRNVAGPLSRFSTGLPVEAELDAGAERTIYRDAAQIAPAGAVSCEVLEVATGQPVRTTPTAGLTLTRGDEEYLSVANFEVSRAGRYRVACSSGSAQPVALAVGPRVRILGSVARVFGAIVSGLAGLLLGGAVVAVVAVKRNRHRRRLLGRG